MPVTHSPGDPFAFTPVRLKGRDLAKEHDSTFMQYKPVSVLRTPEAVTDPDVYKLTFELKAIKDMAQRDKVSYEARVAALEARILNEGKSLEKAESDKQFLFDLQAKQATEIESLRSEVAKLQTEAVASSAKLSQDNLKLREKLISAEEAYASEYQTHLRDLNSAEAKLMNRNRAFDTLKADLTSKNDMLTAKNNHIADLEAQLRKVDKEKECGEADDLAYATKELAAALSQVTSLEIISAGQLAQIHQLKESNATLAVLTEAKMAAEKKLQLMDDMRTALAQANVRVSELESEKSRWATMLGDDDASDLPDLLSRNNAEKERLTAQVKAYETQMSELNVQLGAMQGKLRERTAELDTIKTASISEQRIVLRLQKSKSLATKEIDFLREQLKSYDLEEELEYANYDASKTKRISELERVIDEYRAELAQIEPSQIETKANGLKRERDTENDFNDIERGEYLRKIRGLNAELEILRREDELHRKELVTLRESLQVLSKIKPEQNESGNTHRVLHHKDNPTSKFQAIRTQALKDLQIENAALLAQLAGKNVVTVPIQSLRNAETESHKLMDTIKQKEKMIQRLKEVFSAKSSEFREAVYSLLGYKLDFLPNGRVRLTSMYAEQTDHAFIFDGEAGTMQLSAGESTSVDKANPFLASVNNLISYWSGERHSIPGMLSALTLELLEKDANHS